MLPYNTTRWVQDKKFCFRVSDAASDLALGFYANLRCVVLCRVAFCCKVVMCIGQGSLSKSHPLVVLLESVLEPAILLISGSVQDDFKSKHWAYVCKTFKTPAPSLNTLFIRASQTRFVDALTQTHPHEGMSWYSQYHRPPELLLNPNAHTRT